MSAPDRPALRVISGSPTAEELAVVTAVVAAASAAAPAKPAERRRGTWNDPAWRLRGPLLPGPNSWRASARGLG